MQQHREQAVAQLAEAILSGYVLTHQDVQDVLVTHGYSERSAPGYTNVFMRSVSIRRAVEEQGGVLSRGWTNTDGIAHLIYFDDTLPIVDRIEQRRELELRSGSVDLPPS